MLKLLSISPLAPSVKENYGSATGKINRTSISRVELQAAGEFAKFAASSGCSHSGGNAFKYELFHMR